MFSKALFTFLSLALIARAVPSHKTDCGNGHIASNPKVQFILHVVLPFINSMHYSVLCMV